MSGTTAKPAAEEVRRVLESTKAFLSAASGTRLSEADTRAHFIDPLLRAMGYSGYQDVQREVFLKETKDKLDYVLSVKGEPRVAVEAKAIDVPLTDADAGQVVKYCSILGIQWAVVTNAQDWWLYHQFAQTSLAGKLVFKFSLVGWNSDAEFDALFQQLSLLSKEAFESSGGPLIWVRQQEVDAALRDALTNPKSAEVAYLRKRLAEQRLDVTREDIAAWVRSKLLEPAPSPGQEPSLAGPASNYTASVDQQAPARNYWLAPASGTKGVSPQQVLKEWLSKNMWGFKESTPQRRNLHEGDGIAFYANKKGVIAFATVGGDANLLIGKDEWPEPRPQTAPIYKIPLRSVTWLPAPIAHRLEASGYPR